MKAWLRRKAELLTDLWRFRVIHYIAWIVASCVLQVLAIWNMDFTYALGCLTSMLYADKWQAETMRLMAEEATADELDAVVTTVKLSILKRMRRVIH